MVKNISSVVKIESGAPNGNSNKKLNDNKGYPDFVIEAYYRRHTQ